jgi:hypothetical protein
MNKKGREDTKRQWRYIGPTLKLATNGTIGQEVEEEPEEGE